MWIFIANLGCTGNINIWLREMSTMDDKLKPLIRLFVPSNMMCEMAHGIWKCDSVWRFFGFSSKMVEHWIDFSKIVWLVSTSVFNLVWSFCQGLARKFSGLPGWSLSGVKSKLSKRRIFLNYSAFFSTNLLFNISITWLTFCELEFSKTKVLFLSFMLLFSLSAKLFIGADLVF